MGKAFTIRYRVHWCGPCLEYDDTKTETIIHSDGTVTARNYDHHGVNGHYRIIERAAGSLPKEDAEHLYQDLMDLVHRHDEQIASMVDADAEAIIEAPGIKISMDAGICNGEVCCGGLIDELLDKTDLQWKSVSGSDQES